MKVALLGGGVVGSQVASLLQAGTADFAARSGEQLELVGVAVRDTSKDRPVFLPSYSLTMRPGLSRAATSTSWWR